MKLVADCLLAIGKIIDEHISKGKRDVYTVVVNTKSDFIVEVTSNMGLLVASYVKSATVTVINLLDIYFSIMADKIPDGPKEPCYFDSMRHDEHGALHNRVLYNTEPLDPLVFYIVPHETFFKYPDRRDLCCLDYDHYDSVLEMNLFKQLITRVDLSGAELPFNVTLYSEDLGIEKLK
jgi:hypothetical protein